MSSVRNPRSGPLAEPSGDRSVIVAMKLLARWRQQGFDMVLCHPSGYCNPGNSAVLRSKPPEGYCLHAIDTDEALAAVAASVKSGMAYRI
jgi:hypothetical protein